MAKRSEERSPSEAFPESKWWDSVCYPLSHSLSFSLSSHRRVGGGGAAFNRSAQQLHTQHHIMPGLPTRKQGASYSLRRSHRTGSPQSGGLHLIKQSRLALLVFWLQTDSRVHAGIKRADWATRLKGEVTGSPRTALFTCWYASHQDKMSGTKMEAAWPLFTPLAPPSGSYDKEGGG